MAVSQFCVVLKAWLLLLHSQALWACAGGADYHFTSFADPSPLSISGSYRITDEGALMMPNSTYNGGLCRAVLKDPILLYNRSSGEAWSFSTNFTFTIVPTSPGSAHGDGMAFLIAPSANSTLLNSRGTGGATLGIFDLGADGYDGNPELKVVAIEFDTLKNNFDINDNHVGLDISSVKSIKVSDLTAFGINLVEDAVKNQKLVAWIDYDAGAGTLDVRMAKSPAEDKASANLVLQQTGFNLSASVRPSSFIGFSIGTGGYAEYNMTHEWHFSIFLADSESPASQPPPPVAEQMPSSPADSNDHPPTSPPGALQVPSSPADAYNHPPISPPGAGGSSGGKKDSNTKIKYIAVGLLVPLLAVVGAAIACWGKAKTACCDDSKEKPAGVHANIISTGHIIVNICGCFWRPDNSEVESESSGGSSGSRTIQKTN